MRGQLNGCISTKAELLIERVTFTLLLAIE